MIIRCQTRFWTLSRLEGVYLAAAAHVYRDTIFGLPTKMILQSVISLIIFFGR